MTIKEKVIQILHDLSDDASIEDAMERLLLLAKIERGIQQAEAGETITHAEVAPEDVQVAQVIWTAQAADDLEASAEFIAADSPHFAAIFVLNVMAAVDRIGEFPLAGRVVPETRDAAVRETLLGNYRIIYRVQEELVEILTVYHSARLLNPSRIQ